MSIEKKEEEYPVQRRQSIIERVVHHVCTPVYRPTNKNWEITFKALGWDRKTVCDFWTVFCRVNKSRTGEITIFEFLNHFNLDRSEYVEKCFDYFDTAGGDSIDFLEFMVSVWNICTLKVATLTNFTFDMYDLDSDGELSLPEIERMVLELYGNNNILNSMGREVLRDINQFAEERGGVLSLTSFSIYTMNHSLLLFPIFNIQRTIQKKIMGIKYWKDVRDDQTSYVNKSTKKHFDPRHVQILLRTYKTGAAAAILTHTGDPNVALKEQFDKDKEEMETTEKMESKPHAPNQEGGVNYKYEKLKRAVDKVKAANAAKKSPRKEENAETKRKKAVDMAVKAFAEAGNRAKNSVANSKLSKIPSAFKLLTNELRDQLSSPTTQQGEHTIQSNEQSFVQESNGDTTMKSTTDDGRAVQQEKLEYNKQTPVGYQNLRHKKKKVRPRTAPITSNGERGSLLHQNRSTRFDHRKGSFKKTLRPRTPGSIIYTVNENGDFNREDNEAGTSTPSPNIESWFS